MSLSTSRRALVASPKVFVCAWPAVPMRPNLTVMEGPDTEMSQNLRDEPPTNSNRRTSPVAEATGAAEGRSVALADSLRRGRGLSGEGSPAAALVAFWVWQ